MSHHYVDVIAAVADHERCGSTRVDRSLGIKKMPPGYALMLDPDRTYFYWLTRDAESDIHWNKWAVWRGAVQRAARAAAPPGPTPAGLAGGGGRGEST